MKKVCFLGLLVLIISITSCNSQISNSSTQKGLSSIAFTTIDGGKGGRNSTLMIQKDSIFYESRSFVSNDDKISNKAKLPDSLWFNLVRLFNLDNFNAIKTSTEHASSDGTDEILTVVFNGIKYEIKNPKDDKDNYPKIEQFYQEIKTIKNRMANNYDLNGKTFKVHIRSICEETTKPDPCAGAQVFMTLHFKAFEVVVTENEISTCGKVRHSSTFNTEWEILPDYKIRIQKLISDNQDFIENNILSYNNQTNELVGVSTFPNRINYIFTLESNITD